MKWHGDPGLAGAQRRGKGARRRDSDDANLSIDFLAGFTIFMIAFIYVATLIPGLLINVQGRTIDYDAVAYRTGVILVEDPGMPTEPSWETESDYDKDLVERFGLSIDRIDPNIVSSAKLDRFFCTTVFSYPDDYHAKAIFGDYPYRFNISYQEAGDSITRSVGDVRPDGYGYIRRLVKVKGVSNATIDWSKIGPAGYNYVGKDITAEHQVFTIHLNTTKLLSLEKDPAYRIDPRSEQIMINITDLELTANASVTDKTATLTDLYINKNNVEDARPFDTEMKVYTDGSSVPISDINTPVADNLSLVFPPGFFNDLTTEYGVSSPLPYADLYIRLTFTAPKDSGYLNNTLTGPFEYDYNPVNVTQPVLKNGVLEVAVW